MTNGDFLFYGRLQSFLFSLTHQSFLSFLPWYCTLPTSDPLIIIIFSSSTHLSSFLKSFVWILECVPYGLHVALDSSMRQLMASHCLTLDANRTQESCCGWLCFPEEKVNFCQGDMQLRRSWTLFATGNRTWFNLEYDWNLEMGFHVVNTHLNCKLENWMTRSVLWQLCNIRASSKRYIVNYLE